MTHRANPATQTSFHPVCKKPLYWAGDLIVFSLLDQNTIEEHKMDSIEEAMALAEAGFNVMIGAGGVVTLLSNAEIAKIMEAGDE